MDTATMTAALQLPALPREGAVFSPCGRYRLWLGRIVCDPLFAAADPLALQRNTCGFLLVNPSKADSKKNDPTTTRCINFARAWGFQRVVLVNLFAWCSTDPDVLATVDDPVGPDNDRYILAGLDLAGLALAAWGAPGKWATRGNLRKRDEHVVQLVNDFGISLSALVLTSSGAPGHPVRLPKSLKPFAWRAASSEAVNRRFKTGGGLL